MTRRLGFCAAGLAVLTFGWAVHAQAAVVQVSVMGLDGKPARDAVVWVEVAGATTVPVPPSSSSAPGKAAAMGAAVTIEQRDLQFLPRVSVVRRGTLVRFTNLDPYDHHVRSVPTGPLGAVPPAQVFELRLSGDPAKARSAEVTADRAGITGLGCHLHSSMRGTLFVTDSPHFAKTDAQGLAALEGVPEGRLEVRVWHPDQLADQAVQQVTAGKTAVLLSAPLNFTPRQRR